MHDYVNLLSGRNLDELERRRNLKGEEKSTGQANNAWVGFGKTIPQRSRVEVRAIIYRIRHNRAIIYSKIMQTAWAWRSIVEQWGEKKERRRAERTVRSVRFVDVSGASWNTTGFANSVYLCGFITRWTTHPPLSQ